MDSSDTLANQYEPMQTILIASTVLNMLFIGSIIYLYSIEDERRRKKERTIESEERRRTIATVAAYSPIHSSSLYLRQMS